ncbi:hypothetical protein AMECASPLE_005152 [Ameca splendens]|uniref:Uncharacterized protein n=1 Tax=Ameca splendens TaxID=208324 RepID=A0ABV0ZUX9_9TELE
MSLGFMVPDPHHMSQSCFVTLLYHKQPPTHAHEIYAGKTLRLTDATELDLHYQFIDELHNALIQQVSDPITPQKNAVVLYQVRPLLVAGCCKFTISFYVQLSN